MKLFRRSNKDNIVKGNVPDLTLPMGDGTPAYNLPGEMVDSMRYMITRIGRTGNFPSRLAIVAALRQEGVTYITRALAATLAHDSGENVCIVDVNWWWPSPSDLVAAENPGLAAVVSGVSSLDDVIALSGWPNLAIVPAGAMEPQHRPVMARSNRLCEALDELGRRFDHLILDVPAIQSTSDAIPLAARADACCVVIQQGVTTLEDVSLALDEVDHIPILGVVMNRVQLSTPDLLLKYIPVN